MADDIWARYYQAVQGREPRALFLTALAAFEAVGFDPSGSQAIDLGCGDGGEHERRHLRQREWAKEDGAQSRQAPEPAHQPIDFFGSLQPAALPNAFPELTEREREILGLIAEGQSNAQIARRLSLSGKTVANYVSNIFGKLQVADRAQAMLRARDAGLGAIPRP